MSLTLGEKLRQAREARGITISEVAEQTRISALYLEAIENNDYRTLPGGIFNKGFLKSYAKYVGVDEQEAVQDYNRMNAEHGENPEDPKVYSPEVLTDDHARSSLLPTIIFAVIILGLMIWGILALLNYYNNQTPITANTNANKSTNVNTAANANVANTNPVQNISTNEIKVEFKSSENVSLSSVVDGGKLASKLIKADTPETFTAQQSLKLSYYRGFADKVQLAVNGKTITPPAPPAKGNIIEILITKENIGQILQSGVFPSAAPEATSANTAARR